MAREWENFCVGCPQGCINCGRKDDVLLVTCDICGEGIDYEDFSDIRKFADYDLCDACADALEEALDSLGENLDVISMYGKLLLGDEEWQKRKKQIEMALEEIYKEV